MKLTRLTNHRIATSRAARSSQYGSSGTIRRSSGSATSTAAAAAICSTSRGSTEIGRRSSTAPMAARKTAPASTTATLEGPGSDPLARFARATTATVAAMIAIPAPCGVGTEWEERALGRASA